MIANFEIDSIGDLPSGYQLLEIELPDILPRKRVSLKDLPLRWLEPGQITVTRSIGDEWLADAKHPAIEVPSAVAPETWNTLINPVLLPGTGIRVVGTATHPFDPRLFKVIGS
jgi:RES domain-containing protein